MTGNKMKTQNYKKIYNVTFEVLTAVKMTMLLFWVVTPCRLEGMYKRFRGLKMEKVSVSETLVSTYEPTLRHSPEHREKKRKDYPGWDSKRNLSVHVANGNSYAFFYRRKHSIIHGLHLICILQQLPHRLWVEQKKTHCLQPGGLLRVKAL
jgi:hypothetical protein